MGSRERRAQLEKMYRFQRGRCHWCGHKMLPPGGPKGGGRIDPRLCTYDHFDDRYSPERGKHAGVYRNVAACWACNNKRNKERESELPRPILWARSGAFPAGSIETAHSSTGSEQGNSTSEVAGSSPAALATLPRPEATG